MIEGKMCNKLIEKEIERAVKRIAALDAKSKKSSAEIEKIIFMIGMVKR